MSVAETTAETPATEGAAVPDEWAAALAEQGDVGAATADVGTAQAGAAPAAAPVEQKMNYARAEFQELQDDAQPHANSEANLDVILDVTVTLSMEIGRTKISIRNLLKLNQGSVVELDRLAGEPMDVLVNNCLIAHGEVVVVNDKFGIRLTDVISAAERVKKLK
ncbi:MAG: flagellar motor switch protein FliN [Gammaproteobacteria bacterium]|nr:flagellar motor switch protein FliN [Gammaproteobacteria bacterium]